MIECHLFKRACVSTAQMCKTKKPELHTMGWWRSGRRADQEPKSAKDSNEGFENVRHVVQWRKSLCHYVIMKPQFSFCPFPFSSIFQLLIIQRRLLLFARSFKKLTSNLFQSSCAFFYRFPSTTPPMMHIHLFFVLLFLPYAFCVTKTAKASGPRLSAAGKSMKPAAPPFPVAGQHLRSVGAVTKAPEASASQSSTAVKYLKTAAAMTATAGVMHMYHLERAKAAVLETKASCRTTCDGDLAIRDAQLQSLRNRIAGLENHPDTAALAIARRDVELLKAEKRRNSTPRRRC